MNEKAFVRCNHKPVKIFMPNKNSTDDITNSADLLCLYEFTMPYKHVLL